MADSVEVNVLFVLFLHPISKVCITKCFIKCLIKKI